MADRVAAELERHFQRSRYQADGELVFCHPETGRPYDASKSRKRFKEALRAAGLRPIRFHDLRHTFGTGMAAAGAPLRAIQEWMGQVRRIMRRTRRIQRSQHSSARLAPHGQGHSPS